MGFKGSRGVAFIGRGWALACGPRRVGAARAACSSRTRGESESSPRSGMTDGPHATEEERALGWTGPGGGETGRRGGNEWGAGWAGTKENGPRRRKKKREEGEKESWAGLKAC